jgi:hypothetical protein
MYGIKPRKVASGAADAKVIIQGDDAMPSEELRLSEVTEFTNIAIGDRPEGLVVVQRYLAWFGYLAEIDYEEGVYDEATATALRTFQRVYGLTSTGEFNSETKAFMLQPRCGMPDTRISPRFALTCCWPPGPLTFAFDNGTTQLGGNQEFDAVRAAINTWQFGGGFGVGVNFSEVGVGDSPQVLIGWRVLDDPDFSLAGFLAHSDYPSGCSAVTNNLPKPVHFNDTQFIWSIGAAPP